MSFAQDNVSITLDKAVTNNIAIPADGETDPLKSIGYYSNFKADNLQVTADGKPVGGAASMSATVDEYSMDKPIGMRGEVSGITADLSGVDDPNFKATLGRLGYDGKFSGKILLGGEWNAASGRLDLSQYDIQFDQIGTLALSLVINGYTAELAQRLQKANKMAAESKNPEAMNQAFMQELPNLALESAQLSFQDDSITGRVLKIQAAQLGGSPDDVAKMVPTMIPMMMAGLGNPDFSNMVAGAVGRFLGDPGNLTISVKPEKPVPFSEIMGIGMAAPQTLPDALAVKITANE